MALEGEGASGGVGAGEGGSASFASVFGGSGDGTGAAAGGGQAEQGAQGGAGGGAGNGEGAAAGGADPEWYGQLSAEVGEGDAAANRDYAKSKGWKSLDDVVKSYREAERAVRDSGRIKVPGEGAQAEEVSAFHRAIGVPDTAEGYGLPVPKGSDGNPLTGPGGEPIKLNEPLLQRLAGVAHKSGVPKAAYEALVADFVQSQLEDASTQDITQQQAAQAKMREWGGEANTNIAAVDNAIRALGLSQAEALNLRHALGAGRAMDVLAKLGHGLAEGTMLHGSGGNRFGISGAEAQQQLDAMKRDPAVARKIQIPGSPEKARWDRLNLIVADEQDRQAAA